MDAIKFLLAEHDKVKRTLAKIDKHSGTESSRQKMFDNLCQELIRHETMEQKVWYPALRKQISLRQKIKHLISEEKDAAKTIKKFKSIKARPEWEKKFKAFKKDVEHHADEEEYNLFPKAAETVDKKILGAIGKEMEEFRKEFNKLKKKTL